MWRIGGYFQSTGIIPNPLNFQDAHGAADGDSTASGDLDALADFLGSAIGDATSSAEGDPLVARLPINATWLIREKNLLSRLKLRFAQMEFQSPLAIRAPAAFSNLKSINSSDTTDNLTSTLGAPTDRKKGTISYWVRYPSTGDTELYEQADNIASPTAGTIFYNSLGSFGIVDAGFAYLVIATTTISANTWYHVVRSVDTTQATATNRVKIYVNGSDVTDTVGSTYPAQNTNLFGASTYQTKFQTSNGGTVAIIVDEFSYIDGQALTPTDFADGSNKPKDISGLTFGANGFWWRFETGVGSTAGNDSSGNGNNATSTFDDADFSSTVP